MRPSLVVDMGSYGPWGRWLGREGRLRKENGLYLQEAGRKGIAGRERGLSEGT